MTTRSIHELGRQAIIAYLFLKHGQIAKYYLPKLLYMLGLRDGLVKRDILDNKMYLDLEDEGLSRDLLKTGKREALAVELLHGELAEGDIVADIGANIGYYTLQEASLVGSAGKVYAIEPAPANASLLEKNIELNGYQNIEVFRVAMGNENGTSPFYVSKKRNLSSMLGQSMSTLLREVTVEVVTFDSFFSRVGEYPTFIRMDVEGYEVEIIEGMREFLQASRPLRILMEMHSSRGEEIISMLDTLNRGGFRCKAVVNEPDAPELLIQEEPGYLRRAFEACNEALAIPPSGSVDLSMEDLITGDFLSRGTWVHVLFERT